MHHEGEHLHNIAQELGESIKGAQDIRKHVQYLDDETKFVGFGEHHPADGNTADAAESQANRRVEMLLFEENHEPDLAVLKEAPEASEIYSPDAFERGEVAGNSAKRGAFFEVDLVIPIVDDPDVYPPDSFELELVGRDGSVRKVGPGSPDVRRDDTGETLYFQFSGMSVGTYDLFCKVGDDRYVLNREVAIRRKGVFVRGDKVTAKDEIEPREDLEIVAHESDEGALEASSLHC